MNGFQRIQAVLKGEWPDQRPVMLHNFMLAAKEAGMTMADYRSRPENIARAHIEAAERYGLDGIMIDVDTVLLAGALGARVDFPEDEPARPAGPAITALEQVRDLPPPNVAAFDRTQIWLEGCRLIKEHFRDEVFVRGNCDQCPFSIASMVRGPAEWMMDLMDPEREELVFALLDYCLQATTQFIRLMAAQGVDMVSNGDSPAGPDMISPRMYRKFAAPWEARVVAAAHELGLPYMQHICGDTSLILEDLVETGVDAVELDYKTDLIKIHALCRDRVTLSGTIDPSGVLAMGSETRVEQAVREIIGIYRDSPRLIINAGCAIPPVTPTANIRALVRSARET